MAPLKGLGATLHVQILLPPPLSLSFCCFSLDFPGSQAEHSLCNVEVAPRTAMAAPGSPRTSVRCFNATTPPFFHTNDYRTLKNVTQYKSPSSLHRIARAAAMPVPKTPEVRDCCCFGGIFWGYFWLVFLDWGHPRSRGLHPLTLAMPPSPRPRPLSSNLIRKRTLSLQSRLVDTECTEGGCPW